MGRRVQDGPVQASAASGGGAEPDPLAEGPVPDRSARYYKTSRHTLRRRSMAIRAYVGPNGSGKSAMAVKDLIPSIDRGRPILSTVPIYSAPGVIYENYIPFRDWDLILDDDFRHADIFMDEVTGIANSRDAMGMPRQVQTVLDKLRKRDLTLSWTAPAWKRADTTIRSCTVSVTLCRAYVPQKVAANEFGEIPAWRPKRLFRGRTFDAINFEEFTVDRAQSSAQKSRRLRPLDVEWWWGPGSRPFDSYSSMDAVSRVGEVLDSGRCAHCGGKRPILACKCDDHATPTRSAVPIRAAKSASLSITT